MKIPNISNLQSYVLGVLCSEKEISGKSLRKNLESAGCRKSSPAFYQLMSRLESAGMVEGRYRSKTVRGNKVRERVYSITSDGHRVAREAADFGLALNVFLKGAQNA